MTLESKYLREAEHYSNNNKVPKSTKVGFIYILTNPSFPNYVKLGYADDVDKKVRRLMSMSSSVSIATIRGNLYTKFQINFYSSPEGTVIKTLGMEL